MNLENKMAFQAGKLARQLWANGGLLLKPKNPHSRGPVSGVHERWWDGWNSGRPRNTL